MLPSLHGLRVFYCAVWAVKSLTEGQSCLWNAMCARILIETQVYFFMFSLQFNISSGLTKKGAQQELLQCNITIDITISEKKRWFWGLRACFQHDLLPHNITTVVTSRDREASKGNITVYAATLQHNITTDVKKKRRGADPGSHSLLPNRTAQTAAQTHRKPTQNIEPRISEQTYALFNLHMDTSARQKRKQKFHPWKENWCQHC